MRMKGKPAYCILNKCIPQNRNSCVTVKICHLHLHPYRRFWSSLPTIFSYDQCFSFKKLVFCSCPPRNLLSLVFPLSVCFQNVSDYNLALEVITFLSKFQVPRTKPVHAAVLPGNAGQKAHLSATHLCLHSTSTALLFAFFNSSSIPIRTSKNVYKNFS